MIAMIHVYASLTAAYMLYYLHGSYQCAKTRLEAYDMESFGEAMRKELLSHAMDIPYLDVRVSSVYVVVCCGLAYAASYAWKTTFGKVYRTVQRRMLLW